MTTATTDQMCASIYKWVCSNCPDHSTDIMRIKNICELFSGNKNHSSPSDANDQNYHDIFIDSPYFESYQENNIDYLKSEEFLNKYTFFIKVIYFCLKLNINIFSETSNKNYDKKAKQNSNDDRTVIIVSNFNLLKAINLSKRKLISDHIKLLNSHAKLCSKDYTESYVAYVQDYTKKMLTIEKIKRGINSIIDSKIATNSDNLISMLLPYFRAKESFIEEYC